MRLLEALKKYDPALTLSELIKKVEKEHQEVIEKEELDFHKLAHEFKDVYLKRINNDRYIENTLEVIHIEKVVNKERDIDWNFLYHVRGSMISFSERDLYQRELKEENHNYKFSEKALRKMEVITAKDYYLYLNEYEKIKYELKSLIKGHYESR